MDLEQLKLLIDAAGGLGDGAYSIAMWWIAATLLRSAMWFGLFIASFYWGYRLLASCIGALELEECSGLNVFNCAGRIEIVRLVELGRKHDQ